MLVDTVISGLLLGGLYAIMAAGFMFAFGFTRILNLAHGEIVMISAYFTYFLFKSLGIDPFMSLLIVSPIFFLGGFVTYRYLSLYTRKGSFEGILLLFLAISVILQNLGIVFWTPNERSITLEYAIRPIKFHGITVPSLYVLGFIIGIATIIGLHTFLTRTKVGKALRAVPQDQELASVMGINPTSISQISFGLAFMACAIAGVIMAITFTFNPTSGLSFLLISLSVVVLGGLGSIFACLVGGLIIGVAQSLGAYYFGSGFQLLISYIIFLLILLVKPKGLFGRYVL